MDVESPNRIPRQHPGKEVAHRDDPSEQEDLNAYLEHIGVEIPRAPEAVAVEENPEEYEDPEEEKDPEEEENPKKHSEDE
ncbi:hypothetical protein FNV43_RR04561 [Rhamnella rubrinervis]|uniref:Uncharacterized protein n=1 Tax=Rhamnella rubrinervis TaxID=2594499 RepID=A0A8K0MQ72_9ROSA|nr:hypothetical protein FNV43_RR04561 [Rhamnella rubrinervis]